MLFRSKKKKKKKYQLLYRTWTESSDISNISASSSDSDITRVKINNNLPKIFKKRPYFQKVTSKFLFFIFQKVTITATVQQRRCLRLI